LIIRKYSFVKNATNTTKSSISSTGVPLLTVDNNALLSHNLNYANQLIFIDNKCFEILSDKLEIWIEMPKNDDKIYITPNGKM
jgi:hypothetical protein